MSAPLAGVIGRRLGVLVGDREDDRLQGLIRRSAALAALAFRIHCERVLLHLDSPAPAVHEMVRVLAPGGRLAIWEPDFDALMIDSEDLATSAAVRRRMTAQIRNPDMGRRLNRLALEAGLQIAELSATARNLPNLEVAAAQLRLSTTWTPRSRSAT